MQYKTMRSLIAIVTLLQFWVSSSAASPSLTPALGVHIKQLSMKLYHEEMLLFLNSSNLHFIHHPLDPPCDDMDTTCKPTQALSQLIQLSNEFQKVTSKIFVPGSVKYGHSKSLNLKQSAWEFFKNDIQNHDTLHEFRNVDISNTYILDSTNKYFNGSKSNPKRAAFLPMVGKAAFHILPSLMTLFLPTGGSDKVVEEYSETDHANVIQANNGRIKTLTTAITKLNWIHKMFNLETSKIRDSLSTADRQLFQELSGILGNIINISAEILDNVKSIISSMESSLCLSGILSPTVISPASLFKQYAGIERKLGQGLKLVIHPQDVEVLYQEKLTACSFENNRIFFHVAVPLTRENFNAYQFHSIPFQSPDGHTCKIDVSHETYIYSSESNTVIPLANPDGLVPLRNSNYMKIPTSYDVDIMDAKCVLDLINGKGKSGYCNVICDQESDPIVFQDEDSCSVTLTNFGTVTIKEENITSTKVDCNSTMGAIKITMPGNTSLVLDQLEKTVQSNPVSCVDKTFKIEYLVPEFMIRQNALNSTNLRLMQDIEPQYKGSVSIEGFLYSIEKEWEDMNSLEKLFFIIHTLIGAWITYSLLLNVVRFAYYSYALRKKCIQTRQLYLEVFPAE